MYARFTAFAVWALLAGSIVFWLLKLAVSPLPAPSQALAAVDGAAAHVDLSRLLGSTPVNAPVESAPSESRFKLIGVVAPKTPTGSGEGVALIAIDGKPARPYRLGATVDGDLALLSVTSRTASLGIKGDTASVVLDMPPPSVANNAPIPPPGMGGAGEPATDAASPPLQRQPNAAPATPNNMPFRVNSPPIGAVQMTPGMNPVPQQGNNGNAPVVGPQHNGEATR